MVARFGEKVFYGTRVLVRAESQGFGGSLRREIGFREACVGGIKVTVSWRTHSEHAV